MNAILTNGNLTVHFEPEQGGIITGLTADRGGKVRELVQTPGRPADPKKRGMFNMAPWCGRNPGATMDCTEIKGIRRKLTLQHAADPATTLHGIYRNRPCAVVENDGTQMHLCQRFNGEEDGYSWFGPYQVNSVYRLSGEWELESTLILTNTGKSPFPAVIGEHPMFVRTDGMKFKFKARKILRINPQTLVPDGDPEPVPDDLSFRSLRVPPPDLEVLYIGWDGIAEIDYPDYTITIRNLSGELQKHCLMAWHRTSQAVCALEHQTGEANGANRLNAGKWSGTQILHPSQRIELKTRYTIHPRW